MTEVTPEPAAVATVDRFDVVTVEAQNRVRLKGVQLRPHLDWLAKETVSCISQRGWLDGLVFWAKSYIEDAARAEVQPEKGLAFTYFSTAPSDAPYALTR